VGLQVQVKVSNSDQTSETLNVRLNAAWVAEALKLLRGLVWRSREKSAIFGHACRPFFGVFCVGPKQPRPVEEAH